MTMLTWKNKTSAAAPAKRDKGKAVNFPQVAKPAADDSAKEKSGGRSTHHYHLTTALPAYLVPVL